MSAKGQIVIPKDVRDRLGLVEGTVLDVTERGGEVVLRRRGAPSEVQNRISVEEARQRIQSIYRYDGPPLTLEDMDRAVESAVRQKWESRLGR